MRGLEHLAEAERARMQLGSLAVPYGACVEPANIASMGGACKFMLKCLGCKFFRTTSRTCRRSRPTSASSSRLASVCWPRPRWMGWRTGRAKLRWQSQQELDRVRYLIGRIREAMEELTPAERAELQELLFAERANRSAILERLPKRHELNVLNVGATFDGVAG